jgi:GGDEF domain-containing protein
MHVVAAGFWGAFFGTVALMLVGALVAFAQSHHRVALAAALTASVSALFVVCTLGWLPLTNPLQEARLVAHVGVAAGVLLWLMLLMDLGYLREPRSRQRTLAGVGLVALLVASASWLLEPREAVAYGTLVAFCFGTFALLSGIRSGRRGDRVAWVAVFAITPMLLGLVGAMWIVLDRQGVPWQVHAACAVAGILYLAGIGVMLWMRYSYLIELQEVLAQGPRYDPITRMQSNTGTGVMVRQAFVRQHNDPDCPIVLIAVAIGNLYALENLHGRQALNHALFVCATRLRRCVPADVEIGRLFEDGFLLVSRNARDLDRLVRLGRTVARRLSRPLMLRTSIGDEGQEGHTQWAAQVGVGLLATTARTNAAGAVAKARDMSRTAWSFASRVAWHDEASGAIAELPALEPSR